MKNTEDTSPPENPSPRPVNLPDFILFGAGKSGTTAFSQALSRHPQIFCSIPKEPNYFAYPDMLSRTKGASHSQDIQSESAYRALFSRAHEAQVRGEASVGYFPQINTPGRIHQSIPDVKLIAILRHPVDRAYSSWLHRRHIFSEPIDDFLTACEAGPERVASGWDWYWDYLNTGYYARHLERWFSLFPRAQYKILLYEDWQQNPQQVLQETFRFLGVPSHDSIAITRNNVTSVKPRFAWIYSLLNPSRDLRSLVHRILPTCLRTGPTQFLRRINRQKAPSLDAAIRKLLIARYETDISELEILIQRDLTHWRNHPAPPKPS
jgi:hypothetical protein